MLVIRTHTSATYTHTHTHAHTHLRKLDPTALCAHDTHTHVMMVMIMVMISPSRRDTSPAEQLRRSPRFVPPRFRLVAAEFRPKRLLMIFSRAKDFI